MRAREVCQSVLQKNRQEFMLAILQRIFKTKLAVACIVTSEHIVIFDNNVLLCLDVTEINSCNFQAPFEHFSEFILFKDFLSALEIDC